MRVNYSLKLKNKMTKKEIVIEFEKYIGIDNYSGWYVGITNDIDRRLFGEHEVIKKQDRWIWCPADSKDVAQEVEACFLDAGMDGDTGGGNDDTTFVYAYKKNLHTNP